MSLGLTGVALSEDRGVLSGGVLVDLLVVETSFAGTDVVLLAHFEVLPEVLVAAPPVGVDHAETLVAAGLVEVGVAKVVLVAIGREASVAVGRAVEVVRVTDAVAVVGAHLLLLVLDEHVLNAREVKVVGEEKPHKANTVLVVEGLHLPVDVAEGVLKEARDVLERTPFLGLVLGLARVLDKLADVAVVLAGQSSAQRF